jgi:hypothetical protein
VVISSSFACVFCTTSGQELSELPQLEWKPTQIPHLSTLFFSSCDDSNQHRWRLFKGHTKALEILAQHGVQWQQGHIASRNKRLKRKWNFKIQPTIPSQNVECSQQWSLEKKGPQGLGQWADGFACHYPVHVMLWTARLELKLVFLSRWPRWYLFLKLWLAMII